MRYENQERYTVNANIDVVKFLTELGYHTFVETRYKFEPYVSRDEYGAPVYMDGRIEYHLSCISPEGKLIQSADSKLWSILLGKYDYNGCKLNPHLGYSVESFPDWEKDY